MNWRGRSGRLYALSPEPAHNGKLVESDLYLVEGATDVLWVGSAKALVADAASRSRFRAATSGSYKLYRLANPPDEVASMTLQWDLEAAVRVRGAPAA